MKVIFALVAATLITTACGVDPAINPRKDHLSKAMLEHNDVSLEMQKAWGSKPRSESDTQAQRTWEQQMGKDCNPEGGTAQIGQDLNVIYCEINAMRERTATLK